MLQIPPAVDVYVQATPATCPTLLLTPNDAMGKRNGYHLLLLMCNWLTGAVLAGFGPPAAPVETCSLLHLLSTCAVSTSH